MGPLGHDFTVKNYAHHNKKLIWVASISIAFIAGVLAWTSFKIKSHKLIIQHESSPRMGAEASGLTDAYGKPIDMVADADKLDAGADDDMAHVKKKIAEEQKQREAQKKKSGSKDNSQFESELEALRKVKEQEKAAELAAEKRAAAQRRIAKIREIREGNSEEHKLREKIRREEKIPEISDEEAIWKGFD